MGFTGRGVGIAVLNTGVSRHPDLYNNLAGFYDVINNKRDIYDDNGHGTHIAGIIAGNGIKSNGKYRGVAPNAKIYMYKCLGRDGSGKIRDAKKSIELICERREKSNIRIVNISVGSIGKSEDGENNILIDYVEKLWSLGIVVVAAAGNNGPQTGSITVPGSAKSIITVGASDDNTNYTNGKRKNYSGRGPTEICIVKPEVVCPGTDIYSCNNRNGYSKKSGTSMAVPVVLGIIALMLEKNPKLTNKEIKKKFFETAIDVGLPKKSSRLGIN